MSFFANNHSAVSVTQNISALLNTATKLQKKKDKERFALVVKMVGFCCQIMHIEPHNSWHCDHYLTRNALLLHSVNKVSEEHLLNSDVRDAAAITFKLLPCHCIWPLPGLIPFLPSTASKCF